MLVVTAAIPAWSYQMTINDPIGDQIGVSSFDTKSLSYTVNEIFQVAIATNYPQTGIVVGAWNTQPADLFLLGEKSGLYAIPLVNHGSFVAGQLYDVGSVYLSDDMEPVGGGYGYNHNVPVMVKEGVYTGYNGTVAWQAGTDTDYLISYMANGWLWDENNPLGDLLRVTWATARCANDTVGVPEPASIVLLLCGLCGLGVLRRKSSASV